ncbi:MAG: formylmethanofuran dehydrogenase subunit E family protein [Candidatus Omnitrophota bacterium]
MIKNKISLNEAIKFHGHLGPYLVLGVLAGELALNKLKCEKYFGLDVNVQGVDKKPKSCFIDGLQLSTGATYGKGNIKKSAGRKIKVEFRGRDDKKKISLIFKNSLVRKLTALKTHKDSEILARELYNNRTDCHKFFKLMTGNGQA